MPAPRDESADPLSVLQKQLILSQVQILELEDVRDELKTAVAQRTQLLRELQTVADRALADAQHAQAAEVGARLALNSAQDERQKLQTTIDALRHETEAVTRRLAETQDALTGARTSAAAHAARIGTLDEEFRKLKSSRSWRWTAPLRSVERWFR